MKDSNSAFSMAKVMKWVPILLGIVSLFLGVVALMVKMDNEAAKANMLLFGAFGLFGVTMMVFGLGISSAFEFIGRIDEKTSQLTESEDDIPPGA